MLVLAIESATELAGVALADESGPIATATISRGRRHGESIAPALEFVCRRADVSLGDLDGICVDVGPGLFTGLRVGLATAKALGFALGLQVSTASSLEVLAAGVSAAGLPAGTSIVSVVDAKRGEVFSGRFRVARTGVARTGVARTGVARTGVARAGVARAGEVVQDGEYRLTSPPSLARSLEASEEPLVLAGDGATRYEEDFRGLDRATFAAPAFSYPEVGTLADLGTRRLRAGMGVDASALTALYMREADVRINWEQRMPPRAAAGDAATSVAGEAG
jgi:tRNA threonylcarbamoyladenosine biosynthesis protein TsaB